MGSELRKTGISVVGDMPWGTHFCHFYETKQDLLDTLVPYFKAGLESKEFCLWVVSDPDLVTVEEAQVALAQAVPGLDRHFSDGSIEILNGHDWYFEKHALNLERARSGWDAKLKRALALGYDGLRASADTFWLADKDLKDFWRYEKQVDDWVTGQRMNVMCTYPLDKSGAAELLDVVQAHQFAIARRQGEWEVIETPELIQAKGEIKRLNQELEQRVVERTGQLAKAVEELTNEITDRQQAEVELSLAHQRLSDHVENTPLAVIEWDRDLFIRRWSNRAEEVFGWKATEALGVNLNDPNLHFVYEEDAPAVAEIAEQLMKGTVHRNLSLNRNYTKDGKVIYCEWYNSVLKDENENVTTILSLVHDVTERKQAEEKLHAKEQEFRAIVENAPDHIIRYDREFRRAYVNPAVAKTYGLPVEALIGTPIGSVIQDAGIDVKEDEVALIRQRIATVFETGKSCEFEINWPTPSGRKYFSSRLFPELDLNGSVINVLGIARDITERRQAEEALKQSESQLTEAQRLAHVGSWNWDLQTNALNWSDELYRIFQVDPQTYDPAYEDFVAGFVHPEDRAKTREVIENSLRTQAPFSLHYRILRPDGEERVIHARGDIIGDEHGNPIRVFGTAQDMTERKRAEEKLEITSEQLRALSARVQSAREEEGIRIARELHDELGAALSSLKWDLEEVVEVISESTELAQTASLRKRMQGMIELTDTTVTAVRRIVSELRPIALDELGLSEAVEWQARQFQDRTGITVNCDCVLENDALSRAQSIAAFRISQEALTNILRHAQATTVNIKMHQTDGEFTLAISDNGRGITEDEKLGRSTLGILGMRERAHLIGGTIEFTGSEGNGTVVTLLIPIPMN